ncbi:MAG: hypothetical protein WCG07_00380 [Candidatus Taylorbacteria bacterium]
MPTSYPRKQTIIIAGVCIIAIGATAFYVRSQHSGTTDQQVSVLGEQQASSTIVLATSSEDWKKAFFGATGTQAIAKLKANSATETPEELTATDILGRNFFTQFVQLKQSGLANDQASIDAVNTKLISDSLNSIPAPKLYGSKDITLSKNTSFKDTASTYAIALARILAQDMPTQNEAEVAEAAFSSGDLTQLKNIAPIVQGYKAGVIELLKTPVPQTLVQYHLNLINGLSIQAYNAEALQKSDVDPIRGLAAISLEIKGLQTISEAIGSMQSYFAVAGIPFTAEKSGTILQSK